MLDRLLFALVPGRLFFFLLESSIISVFYKPNKTKNAGTLLSFRQETSCLFGMEVAWTLSSQLTA